MPLPELRYKRSLPKLERGHNVSDVYILRYIVIRTNHYIVIHVSRGVFITMCYGVPNMVLWSAYQNTFIQYA